jgi:hypothetical protein
MGEAEKYLDHAENCTELAEKAKDEPTRARYKRMADAWLALAKEQEWLDGQVPPFDGVDAVAQNTSPS